MGTALMVDNWTLQDVEGLLQSGLSHDSAVEIAITPDRTAHKFESVPEGVLQLDALLTLLTNIVCFDSLTVDSGFTKTWQRDGGFLAPLELTGVVQSQDYRPFGEEIRGATEAMLDQLCCTDSLRLTMADAKAQWRESKSQPDPHFSALVWGGAGMLARSHVTSTPYFGHPVRRKLFSQVPALAPNAGAVQRFESFVNTERAKMFRYRDAQFGGNVGQVVLPPVPVYVIEEASSLHQLVTVAVEMRDQHARLREWLAEYQRAVEVEDERKQIKFEQVLTTVGRSLQLMYGADKDGSVGVSLNTTFLRFDAQRSLADGILNRFGMRSTLTKLLLAPRGRNALTKLVGMLSDPKSPKSRELLDACEARFGLHSPS